ncbi:MAG: SDR family oxidoreductase [Kordiimonas sp.]
MTTQLLVFGPGYSAQPIIAEAQQNGWRVFGTYRKEEKRLQLETEDIVPIDFQAGEIAKFNKQAPTHLLISIAPKEDYDPTLAVWLKWLSGLQNIQSINYLSSTNVYGDHSGGWVEESTPPTPSLARGIRRQSAEKEWQSFATENSTRVFIYRLAGIYGPGRNAFRALKAGRAKCIIKENQVFSRIHVEDIKQTVWAAMTSNHSGGIFNLADDNPTPPHEVIEAAAAMLGRPAPPREAWETADLSEMARSFYLESKRVKNVKIKQELGVNLKYPTYQEGLKALLKTDIL